jgi:hypothetical protein
VIPDTVTVLIDSREKRPLLFPSWIDLREDRTLKVHQIQVKTKRIAMPAGDYTLEGYDYLCVFETKRTLRELHNNVCTNDWERETRALKRLAEACKYPYLVWELTPSELFRKSIHVPDPQLVYDRWMQAIARFNLRLMFAGGGVGPGPRRKLGEQLVRLMLAHIQNTPWNSDPWSDEFREKMWKWAPTWPDFMEKENEKTTLDE